MNLPLGYSLLIISVIAAGPLQGQDRRIDGRVVAPDSSPLPSVRAGVVGAVGFALTDSLGRFSLMAPAGPLRIAIQRIGVLPDTVTVAPGTDSVTIIARPLAILLAPVGVDAAAPAARARFDTLAQPGIVTLSPREILRAPGLLEPDVIRAVQLLPGTVARNDYSIGYNVRGGESDQNLVSLDGVTVFNPSHLGGLFSTFDANAIDRADFFTGGFPAAYPGRLSSVLDVTLRPGTRTGVRGSGLISLLSSRALVEGPLGPASFLVSARRTYADQVIAAFSDENLPYYFTDLLGKIHLARPAGGELSLSGYWGRDAFSPNLVEADEDQDAIDLAFDWGNGLVGLNWRQPVGSISLEQHASISDFSTALQLKPDLARFSNRARLLSARSAITSSPAAGHDLRMGVAVEHYDMRYDITTPALGNAFSYHTTYQPTVIAGFADDQWRPSDRLLVRGGVRAEHVTGAGFTSVSPRGSFKWFLSPDHAVTGAAGRYHQVVHSLRDQEIPIALFEFWIGADANVPVGRSDHVALGMERWFGDAAQVTIEGYFKSFENLVTPNRALALRDPGNAFLPVRGTAWGIDVLLRRHTGRYTGWIAYSFVRAERRTGDLTFPPAHDRRHTINVVIQGPGPLGSELGVRWGYGSPLPYTAIVGMWDHRSYSPTTHEILEFNSREEPIGGETNGARFPNYSRLDVGLHWRGRLWGMRLEPYVEVVNTYNRRNVFTYFFNTDSSTPTRTAIYQLPFLFTFGLGFHW